MARYNPEVQLWEPDAIVLAGLFGGSGTPVPGGSVTFRVPCPDSRVRVKVSVLYLPAQISILAGESGNVVYNQTANLWIAEREEDRTGRRGCMIAVNNIFGTSAVPINVAGDGTIAGYSAEFVTASDEIFGRLATALCPAASGRWILQCRYQPDGLSMDPCEWELVRALCNPSIDGSMLEVSGTGE